MQNRITAALEAAKETVLAIERHIWQNPETGYREEKTARYLADRFEELGYTLTYADGIPGFYTVVDTGNEGPELLILGELDSVICPTHPEADPETGAVHSCGHHAQCAALYGIAAALKDPAVLEGLSGRIRLCAVPAEELLELEYRRSLREAGKIKYFGGKCEFLSRGYFDGVDLAFMVHTSGWRIIVGGANGCIAKNIIYKGKAAHAGGAPQDGVNALYAATCGINAINAIRETFIDENHTRVHPIITAGGNVVNTVPDTAVLESYVRGASFEALVTENRKVNRALCGAALSLGANVEIVDIPGYSPLTCDRGMLEVARRAAEIAFPGEPMWYAPEHIDRGSTDMGDLSCVMPVVHPYCGGSRGAGHGSDYVIADPIAACIDSAKWQLTMMRLLLEDGAKRARDIVKNFTPRFATKEEFLAYKDTMSCEGDRILYREDGRAEVIL